MPPPPPIRSTKFPVAGAVALPQKVHSYVRFLGGFFRNGSTSYRAGSGVLLHQWTWLVLTASHVVGPKAGETLSSLVATVRDDAATYDVAVQACTWYESDDPVYDVGLVALSRDVSHKEQFLMSSQTQSFDGQVVGFPAGSDAYVDFPASYTCEDDVYRYTNDVGLDGMSGGPVFDAKGVVGVHIGKPPAYPSQIATPVNKSLIQPLLDLLTPLIQGP